MADAQRYTVPDLSERLLGEAKGHDFFRLLERLHALHEDDLESSDCFDAEHQRIYLSNHAGLGFPASDVASAVRLEDSNPHQYQIQANFFGMHGADSPLPGFYLDQLAYEARQGVGIRPAFLDFFNHRLLTLLHQAWRKYRYYVRFRPGADDQLSQRIFALIGLKHGTTRGTTPIAWSRLLSFAGAVVLRSRSPTMLAGLIAHCFDLAQVHIRDFELRYSVIDNSDRIRLGRSNGQLGENFQIGESVRTRHCKFTIVISRLSQERFREFLPHGENFERLRKLIVFLLRDPIPCDLELTLCEDEVPPFHLRQTDGTQLGWTSFLEQPDHGRPPPVRVTVRT
ncbi:type VI secretion system baseplate subunit TssG [Pseudomonas sp. R5(2019)]|uniref:type VI secretion system baseplate subunit TssG n=1 Tax=Pseudomonas sp. R5(2019) TaxID=2697566 RepID=UPI0014132D94|nr:type VI secretion system baseplate subunit TssG [Pseudomonas sp. R5(2019)]NBA94150.1 type VI secretion system baseplate subunit TssG [Pseudomonas sp. R5(2019)]